MCTMEIPFNFAIVLTLIWVHIIGDFLSQIQYHADISKKDHLQVFKHTLLYTAVLSLSGFAMEISALWLALNFVLHYLGDIAVNHFVAVQLSKVRKSFGYDNTCCIIHTTDQIIHISVVLLSYFLLV